MLVIPIEESLLYVRPLYLKADTGKIPELKRVIVAYENKIAMEETLEAGLTKLFGTSAGQPRRTGAEPAVVSVSPIDSSSDTLLQQATAAYEGQPSWPKEG